MRFADVVAHVQSGTDAEISAASAVVLALVSVATEGLSFKVPTESVIDAELRAYDALVLGSDIVALIGSGAVFASQL